MHAPIKGAAWLNNQLAPKGYGYLIPFSENEANIVIAYPEYPENINLDLDLDQLWENFFRRVFEDLQQKLRITDNFKISGYIIGICPYPRIGNTFFTGNCFGSIMPLRKSYENSLILRRSLEKLNNPKLDILVESLNTPLGNMLFNSRHYDPLKLIGRLLKALIRIKYLYG